MAKVVAQVVAHNIFFPLELSVYKLEVKGLLCVMIGFYLKLVNLAAFACLNLNTY